MNIAGTISRRYSASQPQTGQSWMQVIEKERGKYPKVKVAYTTGALHAL